MIFSHKERFMLGCCDGEEELCCFPVLPRPVTSATEGGGAERRVPVRFVGHLPS